MYSTYDAESVFKYLCEHLGDLDAKVEKNRGKSKLVYEIYKEQNEAQLKDELPQEGIRVQAKLLQVDDKRVAIEFSRMAGNSLYYHEQVSKMMDALADLNDAETAE